MLTVTKSVKGTFGNKTQDFTFTLTVQGADASEEYTIKNQQGQSTTIRSGGTFTLKDGETVTITLPKYVSITVTEDSQDYVATFQLGSGAEEKGNSKTFELTGDNTLKVVNRRNVLIATGVDAHMALAAFFFVMALAGSALIFIHPKGKEA